MRVERRSFEVLVILALVVLVVAMFAAIAANAQQTAPAEKTILCVRQGVDAQGLTFNARRCRMVFRMPDGFASMVARRKDNGSTLARVDAPAGTEVTLLVDYPLGFPAATVPVAGEVVAFRAAPSDPNSEPAANAAPFQETLPRAFNIPAITVSEFIRALVELGGGAP